MTATPVPVDRRHSWGLLIPVLLVLPALAGVWDCARIMRLCPLGRDHAIFQYISWAVLQGDRLYADMRDVNGPLITLLGLAFEWLGGADEIRFRTLALGGSALSYGLVGAALPDLARAARLDPGIPGVTERIAWGAGAIVVLASGSFLLSPWDAAQRDGFYVNIVLLSLALQFFLQGTLDRSQNSPLTRTRRLGFAAVGALSVLPWAGKPSFLLFTLAQVPSLWWGSPTPVRRVVAGWAAIGATAILGIMALVVLWLGDPATLVRLYTHDVPLVYQYLCRLPQDALWQGQIRQEHLAAALAGAVAVGGGVALGHLPHRMLSLGFGPLAAVLSVTIQAKGFWYHYEPLFVLVRLQWLAILAFITFLASSVNPPGRQAALGAVVLGVLMGARGVGDLAAAGCRDYAVLLDSKAPASVVGSAPYFALFDDADTSLLDQRLMAAHIERVTKPSDRIQVYGMDPWVLYLAHRRSATPYIYAWEIDVHDPVARARVATAGPGVVEAILQVARERSADLLARLLEAPPAKVLLIDGGSLLDPPLARDGLEVHAPEVFRWLEKGYRLEVRRGRFALYGRRPFPE